MISLDISSLSAKDSHENIKAYLISQSRFKISKCQLQIFASFLLLSVLVATFIVC